MSDSTTQAGQRLLAAASELFYRDGINSVGVAGIADAAGVTKKTLYDCYGSKTGLVVAYLRDRHARWWSYMEQRLAEAAPPRALTLIGAYARHPAVDLARGCAFLNGAAELPATHPGFEVIREHKDAVARMLRSLVVEDNPRLADPDSVAEHLFLLAEGAVAQSGVTGDTTALRRAQEIAREVLDSAATT